MRDNRLINTRAKLIGTGKYLFSEAATLAAAKAQGHEDFGDCKIFSIQSKRDAVDIITNDQTGRRYEGSRTTLKTLGYLITSEEMDAQKVKFPIFGDETTPFTQGAFNAVNADILPFGTTDGVAERWYQLYKNGVPLRSLDSVTFAGLDEDDDFFVDLRRGLVRFAEDQDDDLQPVITATAITAGTAGYRRRFLPMEKGERRGFGRVTVFDQDPDDPVFFDHWDFGCVVSPNNQPDVDGSKLSEVQLMVMLTYPFGYWDFRE